jgi:Lipase (class 3)
VVCGHSLGGALATLLVADLAANTPLKPQAWTFASPRVGDAAFAGRYGGLSTVSWRIYNQADIVHALPGRCRRQLPARHRRVGNQLSGEGEVEPALRPRAEHLPARAVARHGTAEPGLHVTRPAATPQNRSARATPARMLMHDRPAPKTHGHAAWREPQQLECDLAR